MFDVAEFGLKAVEEAYRLQQVRFKEGAATTTDVLDAESEVGRARSQATIGRYQYLIAWMALVRAVGQVPEAPAAAPSSPATAPSAP
jgi:outer membrane protein TolC